MQKTSYVIKKIVYWAIVVALIIVAYKIYITNNFNEYIRAEYMPGITKFSRDSEIKYDKTNSYKIDNTDYNDAMFFQKINVVPNTSYRVTCMIKTQDVENKEGNIDAGAHICINETTEKSNNIVGTSDWTKVEFVFNSKNREEVEIGFRLGGNYGNSKGTAWFSNMKIESGVADKSDTWNFLCLIFDKTNVDLNINGTTKNFDLTLTPTDIEDMKTCMSIFKDSMYELSKHKMNVTYEIREVKSPITSMSYDEENGFYVSAYDVKDTIDNYIALGKYDHIFVAFRTGDINAKSQIPVNDWIGLGGMEYRNIGFSNIRLPNSDSNYIYKYDSRINTFPEEVFVHEFLHTLERNAEEYKYQRPELHAYGNYGYRSQKLTGLKAWYADYMNKEIKSSSGELVGLPAEIFTKKPSKVSDFSYPTQLNYLNEPQNVLEELNGIFKKAVNLFKIVKVQNQSVNEI